MERERRNFTLTELRVEQRDDKDVGIGHAAIFESPSEDLGGFIEEIDRGAFDGVLDDDVRALFNHDANFILGRTKSGTLRLSVDKKGLRYEFDIPDTTAGRDLKVSMGRGDIDQSSFGFRVKEDEWEELEDGTVKRTIKQLERLYDVSPVTFPAYPDTDVAKREYRAFVKEKRGQSLASTLNDAIDQMLADDEDLDKIDVLEQMGNAAGISANTVENILSADIDCPPIERLEGFADVLPISMDAILSAAREDGCEYEEENSRCKQCEAKPSNGLRIGLLKKKIKHRKQANKL